MRKKFLTMFLVGAMVLSITACGGKETEEASNTPSQPTVEQDVEENVANDNQQETVVENTDEEVLEGDAPIEEGDGEINDDANRGVETIDLTNTTIYNVAENFNATIELPVFTFAYSETDPYGGISYIARNVDGNNFYETYVLSFSDYSNADNAEAAYAYMEKQLNDYVTDENYEVAEIKGDVSTNFIVMYAYSAHRDNGTEKFIQDIYYVYDAAGTDIYMIKLNVAKDSAIFGTDVLEKSTATYRQEFLNAVLALVD